MANPFDYSVTELYEQTASLLGQYVRKAKLSFDVTNWFDEELWIQLPGNPILEYIDKLSQTNKSETYFLNFMMFIKKLNELNVNQQLTSFDCFLIQTLSVIAATFPAEIDLINAPVMLTTLITHPLWSKTNSYSRILFPKIGRLIILAQKVGNNIFPHYASTIPAKLNDISMDKVFYVLPYIISSHKALMCFLPFIPQLVNKVPDELKLQCIIQIYSVLHRFSVHFPEEHKQSYKLPAQKSLCELFFWLLKFNKSSDCWPLAAFVLPYCLSYFNTMKKEDSIALSKFLQKVTTTKPKSAKFENAANAAFELCFYELAAAEKVHPIISNVISDSVKTWFSSFKGTSNVTLFKLMPTVAVFEHALSKKWTLFKECLKTFSQGTRVIQQLFSGYPEASPGQSIPREVGRFIIEHILAGDENALMLASFDISFNAAYMISRPTAKPRSLVTPMRMAVIARELFEGERLINLVDWALNKMQSPECTTKTFSVIRNIFLPFDAWRGFDVIDDTFVINIFDRIAQKFSVAFIEMYRSSLTSINQVCQVFEGFVEWVLFLCQDRSSAFWPAGISIVAQRMFDSWIVMGVFGTVVDGLLNKIQSSINAICDIYEIERKTRPSPELETKLQLLPFMQCKLSSVPAFQAALKYTQVTEVFAARLFEMIQVSGTIVDALASVRSENVDLFERRMMSSLEQMILKMDFKGPAVINGMTKASRIIAENANYVVTSDSKQLCLFLLRALLIGGFTQQFDRMCENVLFYCEVIFKEPMPADIDFVIVQLFMELFGFYCEREHPKLEVVTGFIGTLCTLLSTVDFHHANDLMTSFSVAVRNKRIAVSAVSVIEEGHALINDKRVHKETVKGLVKILEAHFDLFIDICFKIIRNSNETSFRESVMAAIAKVFSPSYFIGREIVTRANDDIKIKVNEISTSFSRMKFQSTVQFRAAIDFVTQIGLRLKFLEYVNSHQGFNRELFYRAFFSSCVSTSEMQKIYECYSRDDVEGCLSIINTNERLIAAYKVMNDDFQKIFVDHFLKPFLSEPGAFCGAITPQRKAVGDFIKQFRLTRKGFESVDKLVNVNSNEKFKLSEDLFSEVEEEIPYGDFTSNYFNYLKYCTDRRLCDDTEVIGESIMGWSEVTLRDLDIICEIGRTKRTIQFVITLSKLPSDMKNVEILQHYTTSHLSENDLPSEILIDCTNCTEIDPDIFGKLIQKLKPLGSSIKRVYLLNACDIILDVIDRSVVSDEFSYFSLVDVENALKVFPVLKLPSDHIMNDASYVVRAGDSEVIVTSSFVAVSHIRLFLQKDALSYTYYPLFSVESASEDKPCLDRAIQLKRTFINKHVKRIFTTPFHLPEAVAEILCSVTDPSATPKFISNALSIVNCAAGFIQTTIDAPQYDFDPEFSTAVIPLTLPSALPERFVPIFIKKLLEREAQTDLILPFITASIERVKTSAVLSRLAFVLSQRPEDRRALAVARAVSSRGLRLALAGHLIRFGVSGQLVLSLFTDDPSMVGELFGRGMPRGGKYADALCSVASPMICAGVKQFGPEMLAFGLESAYICLAAEFGVFARFCCLVELHCFGRTVSEPKKRHPSFFEACMQGMEAASFRTTELRLLCGAVNGGDVWADLKKAMAQTEIDRMPIQLHTIGILAERQCSPMASNGPVPKRFQAMFSICCVSLQIPLADVRMEAVRALTHLLRVSHSLVPYSLQYMGSRGILAHIKGSERGSLSFLPTLLQEELSDFHTSAETAALIKQVTDAQRIHAATASVLVTALVAHTVEEVEIERVPADQWTVDFLANAFCDTRAHRQAARICRALCQIGASKPQLLEPVSQSLFDCAMTYLEREVNASVYGPLSDLLRFVRPNGRTLPPREELSAEEALQHVREVAALI